jgi:hypothetical protein
MRSEEMRMKYGLQTLLRFKMYRIFPKALFAATFVLALLSYPSGAQSVTGPPPAQFRLTRLSTDTFTNADGQHATELETSTYSHGSTMVVTFEVARGLGHGGGADIGIAITTDAGTNWSSHFLSGLTIEQGGAGIATGNANVTYDAAHRVWLIQTLILMPNKGTQLVVLRSADGNNCDPNPIPVVTPPHPDKPWIACDNTPTSPFYGHCYIQWDTVNVGTLWFTTSTDGGLTWGSPRPAGTMVGGNGQVHVQPYHGCRPHGDNAAGDISPVLSVSRRSFTDGGSSWNAP